MTSGLSRATWFEPLIRAGFLAYGVLHLLFAYVIGQIAFGDPAAEGDQSGALHKLADEPFGTTLIVLIVIGLAAMALWQILEAVAGHRLTDRAASAGRAAFYLYLGWNGVKVLRGKKTTSADTQQAAAEGLLDSAFGRLTVIIAGVVVVAIGAGLIVAGVTRRFEHHLHVSRMTPAIRRTIRNLGVAGFTTKGFAYGVAGVLLVTAAVRYDPDKARGLDAALRALAAQPYGMWFLLVAALGFVAYGLFAITESRYRKV